MHIKRYIFFSILLMAIVGGLVYWQIDQTYTVEMLGIPITLPVAAWVVLPMFLMFIVSFFHMSYYSFINFMILKRYKKDYDTLVVSFANALMREPKTNQYKTKEARNLGRVSDRSHILPIDFKIDTKDERLKRPLEYIKDIQNGIYVDIEGFKLSPKNPLLVKNIENRMKEEPTYSGVVLKNCDAYPQELCKEALKTYIGFGDMAKIKDYGYLFDKETLFYLIEQSKKEGSQLGLSYQDILYILQESKMKLDRKDYIDLAISVKEVFSPDERLKFFEILKNRDEKSEAAYVYTLFDLEMIERAKEFLETTQEDELLNFKAYLELKECGRNYPLELFV